MVQQYTLIVTWDNYSDTVLCSEIAFEQLQKYLAEMHSLKPWYRKEKPTTAARQDSMSYSAL